MTPLCLAPWTAVYYSLDRPALCTGTAEMQLGDWNSPAMMELRRNMHDHHFDALPERCQDCLKNRASETLAEYLSSESTRSDSLKCIRITILRLAIWPPKDQPLFLYDEQPLQLQLPDVLREQQLNPVSSSCRSRPDLPHCTQDTPAFRGGIQYGLHGVSG